MQVAIVSGSHRKDSESERIARKFQSYVEREGGTSILVSLAGNPFPLWDEERWSESPRWEEVWGPTSANLVASSGIIVVTPEWGGMVPAGLKNFFLLCQSGELAHKPGLIVSVSSGIGGSYPIAELRTSSYKNTKLCYLPEHIVIRNCATKLQDGDPHDEHDTELRDRSTYAVRLLLAYAEALSMVRSRGIIDSQRFPYGM